MTHTATPASAYRPLALVVDDVALHRDIASSALRGSGYDVVHAKNGAEAIEAIANTDFDVVLMDVRMRVMDGLEATSRIRKLTGSRGKVPILAVTSQTSREQKMKFFDVGMDGHVAKPYSVDMLRIALARVHLRKRSPSEGLRAEPTTSVEDPVAIQRQTRRGTHTPQEISGSEVALTRPEWADFYMEQAYWDSLIDICNIEEITHDKFIEDARLQHLGVSAEAAVRTQIALYFRRKAREATWH